MADAFATAFSEAIDRTVLIGTDCPEITEGILGAAFDALRRHDLVLGPATDGGYYLLGMRQSARDRAVPHIFENIDWGTGQVFESTIVKIEELGLKWARLAPLDDVDRPEDLAAWDRAQADTAHSPEGPCLSVIVPALNEADHIEATLGVFEGNDAVEVIVVDGGSVDDTRAIARDTGADTYESRGGRAAQLNLGAAKARAAVLLFLHADTLLPEAFDRLVLNCLSQPGTVAGAFELAIDEPTAALRFIAAMANLRARWLGLPYGDQAIFVRKDLFREIGGYRPLPIMEDFDLVRRLGRRGRIGIVAARAITSGRRWRTIGTWRTTLLNQAVIVLYYLGFSPERIAALYNRSQEQD